MRVSARAMLLPAASRGATSKMMARATTSLASRTVVCRQARQMCTAPPAAQAVTKAEVVRLQTAWANAITTISSIHKDKGDYVQAAADAAAELYGYGHSQVLFKPTKAVEHTFRPTGGEAMSYFVGGSAVEGGYSEDAGFAINGGNGWSDVVFDNHAIDLNGPVAIAMGLYVFTCATTGQKVPVEYTFGYKRNQDGKARIFLHHSSVPYSP